MENRRKIYLGLFVLVLVAFFVSFASINFSENVRKTITGYLTSGSTGINITLGASPVINELANLTAQTPEEGNVTILNFTFSASDADGADDLDNASARLEINFSSESVRSNYTCAPFAVSGTSVNYTCDVELWYFDGAGGWTINATINDTSGNLATNNSLEFVVNQLVAMVVSPSDLTWGPVAATDTNTLFSNGPFLINNTGNADISSPNIQITGIDLIGETTASDIIYAGNFTVDETNACDAGPAMVNASATGITGAVMNAGNNSLNDGSTGQEQLYFCLEVLDPIISSQAYATPTSWTVAVS